MGALNFSLYSDCTLQFRCFKHGAAPVQADVTIIYDIKLGDGWYVQAVGISSSSWRIIVVSTGRVGFVGWVG
jgi:hypothetical protein